MELSKKPPVDLELLTSLAKRFADREMFDEAAELFELALRFVPHNLGIQLHLAEIRKHKRQSLGLTAQSAEEALREQFRRNAIDSAHFFGLAALYDERGKPDLAAECLGIARRKEMVNPFAHKLAGKLAFRDKEYDGARRELRFARRYNPFDREVADLLGRVEYEREHYQESLEATIDAFLLLREDDLEGADQLKERIRQLKLLRKLSSQDLIHVFRERREMLEMAFERLELQRERHLREEKAAAPKLSAPKHRGGRLDLARRLRALELWSHLDDEQIFHLTRAAQALRVDLGAEVFEYESEGTDIYILDHGRIAIRRPTPYGVIELGTITPGGVFGEANFIARGQRTGDAVATKTSELICLRAGELEILIEERPGLGVGVYSGFWRGLAHKLRSANEELRTFFPNDGANAGLRQLHQTEEAQLVDVRSGDKIKLLREQGLSGAELEILGTLSNVKRYPGGTYLFHEGDPGREMYVVLEGRVMISKFIPGGGEEALAILGRGDLFGEMSLIDGEPRSADAKSFEGPAMVLVFDDQTLGEVLSMDPTAACDFMKLLCRLVTKRLREIDEKVTSWRLIDSVPRGAGRGEPAISQTA